MTQRTRDKPGAAQSAGRYILIGIITAAPLAITWWIVAFLFTQLSRIGRPWVSALARFLQPEQPLIAAWLASEQVQSVLAALTVLLLLYLLGRATTIMVGRRLIALIEGVVGRIPFVDTIYRSIKKFLVVASVTPEGERRVVLISFPSREMKVIGLVTRILQDSVTGEELAAVYVPTSPNPTSGYIEIVPVRDIVFTDWTFDQAMAFIVTGGANAPDSIAYTRRQEVPAPAPPPP
jgi:uncharacterized membrane protein